MLDTNFLRHSQEFGISLLILHCVGKGTVGNVCVLVQIIVFVFSYLQPSTLFCQHWIQGKQKQVAWAVSLKVWIMDLYFGLLFLSLGRIQELGLFSWLHHAELRGRTMASECYDFSSQFQGGCLCTALGTEVSQLVSEFLIKGLVHIFAVLLLSWRPQSKKEVLRLILLDC